MKKKLMFLSGFFLSNFVISFSTSTYQNVYQQILIQVDNNLKQKATIKFNQELKNNIITNFNNFGNKSIKLMATYQQAQLSSFLAEEIISGKEHKNEIIKILKSINVSQSEIKAITTRYEEALIAQVSVFNPSDISDKQKELDNFIDLATIKIDKIYIKTFEKIDFNKNYITEVVSEYDLLLREVQEKDLNLDSIEDKLSLNFFEKVNHFLIKIKNLEEHIKQYIGKVLDAMIEDIDKISSEVKAIKTNLNQNIPESILKKLHDFETNYFTIKKTFSFLKLEFLKKDFSANFLVINTKLMQLEKFLLVTNENIIDLLDQNINDISQNLETNEKKITEPGVWENIVKDYKLFLNFKKEIAVIAEDTKKMLDIEYSKIKQDIAKLEHQFNKIEYKGITKVEVNKEKKEWEIYLSASDTQKLNIYASTTTISIPVGSTVGGIYGTFKYMKKAGSEGASRWVKGGGAIFGGFIMGLLVLFDLIPVLLINATTQNSDAGVKFKISFAAVAGATLAAAISLAATVEKQEKKYLTLE